MIISIICKESIKKIMYKFLASTNFYYVSKVSTRFEFFQPRFAYVTVLAFVSVVLDAEFCAESNVIIFGGGYRSKIGTSVQNTWLFRKSSKSDFSRDSLS